jgi:hypothetical protein
MLLHECGLHSVIRCLDLREGALGPLDAELLWSPQLRPDLVGMSIEVVGEQGNHYIAFDVHAAEGGCSLAVVPHGLNIA